MNTIITKMKHLFQGILTCFGGNNKTGVVLDYFQNITKFSHIMQKVLMRAFQRCG